MKINKIKINSYGKLKNKEINLNNNINIIYGKNESGKSTLLKFILNIFYGTSKNKKGKEISDFEKYKPWDTEEFSGKLLYELDNKNKYEIFREFNKKNPKIFNENGEEITKEFNINKNSGSEFFYEQTQLGEKMFLATSISMQQEVKIGKNEQSMLIQKISNVIGTGEDKISYKKVIDKINKKQLEEIGSERTREKPINIIQKNIEKNTEKIKELKKYENIEYEIEKEKNEIKNNLEKNEIKNNLLREIKKIKEKNNLENEKIKIKENILEENKNKLKKINDEIKNKNNLKININKKTKINKKNKIIFSVLILISILWLIFADKFTTNKIIKYIFLLTAPTYLIFLNIFKNKSNKKIEKNIENKKNSEINYLENEEKIIKNNSKEILDEINKIKIENNFLNNLEKEKIINKYSEKINKNLITQLFNSEKIDEEINTLENKISNDKIEINKLEIKRENIEPQLENLSILEEELFALKEKNENLQKINESIELAKKLLEKSYEKMKNNISPKFIENLSENIEKITNGRYSKLYFSEEDGLIIELKNGDYVSAERLSIGTIDQLYLSLRLAMLDEISNEKVPIILDEVFAYYDEERLTNILKYLNNYFSNRQIIILTCTNREKNILERNSINFNYVEL
mgnify:CR=1 FL=1